MSRPPPHVPGKEGVDGSSPSAGAKKGQQMVFFVVLGRYDWPVTCPHEIVPDIRAQASSWLEEEDRRPQSPSVEQMLCRGAAAVTKAPVIGCGRGARKCSSSAQSTRTPYRHRLVWCVAGVLGAAH